MRGVQQFRPLILSCMRISGLFSIMRAIQRRRLIIVMYHRFTVDKAPFKLPKSTFEKQLKFFKKHYNIISFDLYIEFLDGKTTLPTNPLIITFDDGYYDNYSIAYPLLKKYSAPATIFVSTNFISHNEWLWSNKLEYILWNSKKPKFTFDLGKSNFLFSVSDFSSWHKSQLTIFNYLREIGNHRDDFLKELASFLRVEVPAETTIDYQSLDWSHVLEMQQNEITIGSHTCSHPILSSITEDELHREIEGSKTEIEAKTGEIVDKFCYPNGQSNDFNDDVVRIVEQSGYITAVTTIPGFNYPAATNSLLLKRCTLGMDKDLEMSMSFVRLP